MLILELIYYIHSLKLFLLLVSLLILRNFKVGLHFFFLDLYLKSKIY